MDNRPGSGGIMGVETVARETPDGYTLFVTPSAVLTINPQIYSKLRYDTFTDFAPITMASNSPYFLVVHPKIPGGEHQRIDRVCESQSRQDELQLIGQRLVDPSRGRAVQQYGG